jgi:GTP-dependent phosphoenolpyruvate carboxykinase
MGEYRWVHQLLDHPWQEVFGKEHRRIMHDQKTVAWIESQYGPMASLVARSHIAIDLAVSSAKKRGVLK